MAISGIIVAVGLMVVLNKEVPKVKADDATPSVLVGNTIPVASSAEIPAIVLNEGTTKSVAATSSVTDNNGYEDLTLFEFALYATGTTCGTTTDADPQNCYFYATTSTSTFSCSGITCSSVTHTFDLKWYADPGDWYFTITPYDESTGTADTSSVQTIAATTYLDVDGSISYPSTLTGATSSGTGTGATVTNTGNADIGVTVSSAAAMSCDGRGTIPVANQHYATSTFAYEDGVALSGGAGDLGIIIAEQTSGDSPTATSESYWHISVPTAVEGTCTGTIAFSATAK